MKNYHSRKILNENQIIEIRNLLEESNKKNFWEDGLNSAGSDITKETKNNLELNNVNYLHIINKYIMDSLDQDKDFMDFTAACTTQLNIVSKTLTGGYYNPHIDNWRNGDYSTTVFLNNPDEYEGGELCLYFGGEEELKIKLKSGWGITYPTGIIHRVNKVKSGVRYASIFWTKSLIKDEFIRFVYSELGNIENNLTKINQPIYHKDCYSSTKDPLFSIRNLKNRILIRHTN